MFLHTVRIVAVPFYRVRFPDFFIGDQMTSHNQTLIDGVHLLVNLCSLSFVHSTDRYLSLSPSIQQLLQFLPNLFPTLIRFVQCLRRYYDTHDVHPHLFNGVKYGLSILAMCFFWNTPTHAVLQCVYTLYALNWDLREDWGLLHNFKRGKWFLLRSTKVRTPCLLSEAWMYYAAMANNIVLRFFWILKLSLMGVVNRDWLLLFLGCAEVIRRGWWNIFRMENEQVNNCGKFRATLDVPVPFPDL